MTITGDHSPEGAEDAHRAERPKLSNQKLKRSGHCALSIKEKPLAWDPECQGASRKAAWQRHHFQDFCPVDSGNLSPAFCHCHNQRPSTWPPGGHTQQWYTTFSTQSPTSSDIKRKHKLSGKIEMWPVFSFKKKKKKKKKKKRLLRLSRTPSKRRPHLPHLFSLIWNRKIRVLTPVLTCKGESTSS